jgi:very-short-patch-repair endonuclease
MLELILTRVYERRLVDRARGLHFLVLDELHTYRGRQGADVAMLVRRVRDICEARKLQCIGTSATLAAGGSWIEERARVATVASQLFGTAVAPENVIGETLRPQTIPFQAGDADFVQALRDRVSASGAPSDQVTAFNADPLSRWIEATFGMTREADTGRYRRAKPLPLRGEAGAAAQLAELTRLPEDQCAHAIQQQLLASYAFDTLKALETGLPLFAFRLNQFIARGSTVYASLESADCGYITTEEQRFVPGDRHRVLLPLLFCRECGQGFYAVERMADSATGADSYVPRDIRAWESEDESSELGYLYHEQESPWFGNDANLSELYPEDWLDEGGKGMRLRYDRRKRAPVVIRLDAAGKIETEGRPYLFIKGRLDFCPHCGISYDARQRSDIPKLAGLDAGGRSTATTVLALSALLALANSDLPEPARKLLSFTDNRQDAALQSGHFSDFLQVGLLRSALYRAVSQAGADGLKHDKLPQAVFQTLALPPSLYAQNPTARFGAKQNAEQALCDVLAYRLYHDQRRGWRISAPNLEQCGLLTIRYASLGELCQEEAEWQDAHAALVGASATSRARVCRVLLDLMRRSMAIFEPLLLASEQDMLRRRSQQHLIPPWSVDDRERLVTAYIAFPRSRTNNDKGDCVYISGKSAFGKFLRRASTWPEGGAPESVAEAEIVIRQLLEILTVADLARRVTDSPRVAASGDDPPGYQVPSAALLWCAGDGQAPQADPLRVTRPADVAAPPNPYFVAHYGQVAAETVRMRGAEHTAQVPNQVRQDREKAFRQGDLQVLFCSPTMELGIDIAQLNVVNMRNVPPTPANYAQRSGRAGRSGQPALVFTYCTRGSPHDQYYFRHPQAMVSGVVSPPRLDLANEDLIRAHLDAVWLWESGLGLRTSLRDILNVEGDQPDLALQPSVKAELDAPAARHATRARMARILETVASDLADAPWYHEGWLNEQLQTIAQRFDAACERWRDLYRAASFQRETQHSIIGDASASSQARDRALRLRREAEQQLALLLGNAEGSLSQSDFYSYRYFASEGFLPGYSFPRLPLAAYIPGAPGAKSQDDLISRARFLALAEFGPKNIIYHEGMRYQVNRVLLQPTEGDQGDTLTRAAKTCPACGQVHPLGSGDAGPDRCAYCDALLDPPRTNLFRMRNVATVRRDRINSDEEERTRMGYEMVSGIHFDPTDSRRCRRATVTGPADSPLFSLTHVHAAELWRINLGWRRRGPDAPDGFVLDVADGRWGKLGDEPDEDDDPMGARTQRVVPYVEDHRNALLLRPEERLDTATMASLAPALARAIAAEFQLEESEIAVEPMPSEDDRRYILMYESAEGGAGVLRQLVDDPTALPHVARKALELCHFDPDTDPIEDLRRAASAREDCEAACYDCLMSYYNQRDHHLLDRFLVRNVLRDLASAQVRPSPNTLNRSEHLRQLLDLCDSDLERDWLHALDARLLRLPDQAQHFIEEAVSRPDFLYRDACVAVFVDGMHHRFTDVQARDRAAETRLLNLGYTSVRFGERQAEWPAKFAEYAWVFGRGVLPTGAAPTTPGETIK